MVTDLVDNVHRPWEVVSVLVIHGTRKFLLRVGRPDSDTSCTTKLGAWYATILFWRPQVVLFVNERSLFPVMVPLAPALSVVDRFREALVALLQAQHVEQSFIDHELAEMSPVSYRPTSNRSVVGIMNEFAFLAGEYRGRTPDLTAMSLRLAHTPCGPLRKSQGFPDLELMAVIEETSNPEEGTTFRP
jgi:hypothetical protein